MDPTVKKLLLVAVTAALLLGPRPARACTTFMLERGGQHFVGKSYDWDKGQGLVVINKAGVGKRALSLSTTDTPATWVSRHASVTFNQFGRELPNGGMNDAGLVVEVMWLDTSVFPAPDARLAVNELQFVQWLLDEFSSVGEVVQHAGDVRVSLIQGKVHSLACDTSGACAALEFLDGALKVTSGPPLEVKVLTNTSYVEALQSLHQHAGFGGKKALPKGASSMARFARAASLVRARAKAEPIEESFRILDAVANDSPATQWRIVYAPEQRKVWFRTHASAKVKSVDLTKFDASCGSAVRVLDIDSPLPGESSDRFEDYTDAANLRLVKLGLAPFLDQLPPGTDVKLAGYPSRLPCTTVPATGSKSAR